VIDSVLNPETDVMYLSPEGEHPKIQRTSALLPALSYLVAAIQQGTGFLLHNSRLLTRERGAHLDKRKAASAGVIIVVARADASGRLAARSHFDCQLKIPARSGEVIYFSSERAKLGAAHSSARFPTFATNRRMHGITNSSLGHSYPSPCRHRI
jgi:hypothetical protein